MRRLLLALCVLLLGVSPSWAAKIEILKGTTCANTAPRPCLVEIFIQDSSSTTGAGLGGLTSASAGLVCNYGRSDQGAVGMSALTLAAGTLGTWSSGGFIVKDATNALGVYELGVSTAMVASGSNFVLLYCKGATNMAPMLMEIHLTDYDPQDSVRLGLTALPNVASGSAGALPTTGTGANQVNVAGGRADANVLFWNGAAVVAPITAGVPVVDWTPSPAELTGTATASAASTITLAAAASATANFSNGMSILITSGTGKGQVRIISAYSVGRVATVTPAWTTIPAATATYIIFPHGLADLEVLLVQNSGTGAALTAATAGLPDVNVKNFNNAAAVSLPTNFNLFSLDASGRTDLAKWIGVAPNALIAGRVDANAQVVGDKTGYSLTQTFPTNFSSLAITVGGAVTAGTVSDKTGYSLTQTFPTNFSTLSIDANGRVKIQAQVQQNVALAAFEFLMTDSTNHAPVTGKTPACTRSIDGGVFGAGTLSNILEVANGFYKVDFGAGDLNGKNVVLRCTATASDDSFVTLITYP